MYIDCFFFVVAHADKEEHAYRASIQLCKYLCKLYLLFLFLCKFLLNGCLNCTICIKKLFFFQ